MGNQKLNQQDLVYEVEWFLRQNYEFRHNVLSNKTEYREIDETVPSSAWMTVTPEALNSIVRSAKCNGIGGKSSPKTNIEEFVHSNAIPSFDPIQDYLDHLPAWDGKNHVAELFNRIPGLTSEQLNWCSTWLRSSVAHWRGLDHEHGNECLLVLIGEQGCGKTTFALRLLPPSLRSFYLDHINFGNKFDADMALTNNLLVNIDELANIKGRQQLKLKQTLSKQKVNGRTIFGKTQADRRRYASFLATTNDEQPLNDPTGSRRFLCLQVPHGMFIDNEKPIDYEQLYAQVVYELDEMQTPYWFTNDEVKRIQGTNLPYFQQDVLNEMISIYYRVPEKHETGEWIPLDDVLATLQKPYPMLQNNLSTKIKIGKALKNMGSLAEHTRTGAIYKLINLEVA